MSLHSIRAGTAVAVVMVLAGPVVSAAAAAGPSPGPLVAVSPGSSPLASCTADKAGSQSGTSFPSTEIEPWAGINPSDVRNILVGQQQDRWSDGGARALLARVSKDGGSSWQPVVIPKISLCSGGSYQRTTDPWVTFSPDGTAYFFSLAFDEDLPNGGSGPNAMLISRSVDGGVTWGDPFTLKADTDPQFFNDKNSATADPKESKYVYAVWDRLQDFTVGAPGRGAIFEDRNDGVALARGRLAAAKAAFAAGKTPVNQPFLQFKGPAYFARTTDGGKTWEAARQIYDPGLGNQTIGNQVAVTPSGSVIDFFTQILNTAPGSVVNLAFVKSGDKGTSFGPAVGKVAQILSSGAQTPDQHREVRDGSILFDVAVDASTGALYAVWQDRRFDNIEQVAFAMSEDGGATWSAPIRVDQAPANKNKLREQAFVPSIAVAGGKVVVTWYDFRFDTKDGRELADHWAVFCTSQCTRRSSWGNEVRLTADSFDLLQAPSAGGLFLGDYMGLAVAGSVARPVFGVADGQNQTSLFTRAIDLSGLTKAP